MGIYDWSLSLSAGDKTVDYRWREHFHRDGSSLGYWGFIVDPVTGDQFTGFDEFFTKDEVINAVRHFRYTQVRKQLHRDIFGLPKLREGILELFARTSRGEFLGQLSGNSNLYVQEIATIMELDFARVLVVVDELVKEGLLGLHGMIIIANEIYEEEFRAFQETTGHKRLSASDSGWWACSACGAHGSDYDDPTLIVCEEPEDAG